MQDTFYVSDDIVLRTHTSPVQVRVMDKDAAVEGDRAGQGLSVRLGCPHTPMFHQVEGFMVDTDIAFSDLKGVLELFIHGMFSTETPCEVQAEFFPVYRAERRGGYRLHFLLGKGCRVCKHTGWLEILGAGMINPRVFEFAGYAPGMYSGFAFGYGGRADHHAQVFD